MLLIGGAAVAIDSFDSTFVAQSQGPEQHPDEPPTAPAADASDTEPAPDAVQQTYDATVVVYNDVEMGSAVAIDETTFLTANHVVEDSDSAQMALQDGTTLDGTVIKRDPTKDPALIQTEPHGLPVAQIAPSNPSVDDPVYAFGAPNAYIQVSTGYVTGVYDADGDGVEDVETDAALRHGNSGGPLVNEEGQVVGIALWIAEEGGVYGYAASVEEIQGFLNADSGWPYAAA